MALIPSIEFFQNPHYRIVSDACIACRGPVLSVKLFGRKPAAEIRSLALDVGSRTSAALVQILLAERFGLRPAVAAAGDRIGLADTAADAVLLIGDRAMQSAAGRFAFVWDLGDEWCRWSELPFVFAMWVARPGIELGNLETALGQAREAGVAHLDEIAERKAPALGLTRPQCLTYLRDNLYFYLGPRELGGLDLFYRRAVRSVWPPREWILDSTIARLLAKAVDGERLTPDEGLGLLESHDLAALGRAADAVTARLHPETYRTYNIDRNINYTNICTAVCDFCAFYRRPKHPEGYVLDREVLMQKIQETVDSGRRPDSDARRACIPN